MRCAGSRDLRGDGFSDPEPRTPSERKYSACRRVHVGALCETLYVKAQLPELFLDVSFVKVFGVRYPDSFSQDNRNLSRHRTHVFQIRMVESVIEASVHLRLTTLHTGHTHPFSNHHEDAALEPFHIVRHVLEGSLRIFPPSSSIPHRKFLRKR